MCLRFLISPLKLVRSVFFAWLLCWNRAGILLLLSFSSARASLPATPYSRSTRSQVWLITTGGTVPMPTGFQLFQFFHISSAALPEGIDEFVSPHSPRCHACRTVLFCSAQWFMPFPFNSFVERLRAGGRLLFIKRNYPRNRRLQAGAQQHTH